MIGIAAGLSMSGLILGAFSGSVWIMVGFFVAGVLVAGIADVVKHHHERTAASCKLAQYPPYGY